MPAYPPDLTDVIIELERRIRVLEGQSYIGAADDPLGIDLTITGLDGTVSYNEDDYQQIVSARVYLFWDDIVQDPDDGDYDPLHYQIRYSIDDDSSWTPIRTSDVPHTYVDNLPLGHTVYFEVRAVTQSGRKGDWTEINKDTGGGSGSAPATPSTPTATGIYVGVRASWDGLDSVGSPMSPIFSHVEVHLSTSTGFTPSTSTLRGIIVGGAGSLSVGVDSIVTWYTKLIAVDRVGQKSSASAQASALPLSTPDDPDTVYINATQTLANKTYKGAIFADTVDATKKIQYILSFISTATTRTWTFPNVSDSFVGASATQTLTGKTYNGAVFCDSTDTTKKVSFDLSGITTGTTRPWAFPDINSATFASTNGIQTFNNKRIKMRVTSFTSGATRTVDETTENMVTITALAVGWTGGVPGGSPDEGDIIYYRIKDNGTIRALGFNAIYRAQAGTGKALPTTTTVGRTMYIQFIYNATDTKWDLMDWWEN